jgi:hypothetical protein
MGRLRSRVLCVAMAVSALWSFSGCGSKTKAGTPIFPGRIILLPASNTSLLLGGTLNFSSSVQTSTGTTINTPVFYTSSDTSILTIAPNGVACAGHWDIAYTTCSPGGTGPVTVTASALGGSSVPTWVFVHAAIDNVTVTGVLLNGVPVQEPCLSQSQSMTLEAHAYNQGNDITSSVGPFTWFAQYSSVVSLTPVVNTYYNFATNEVTARAALPGMTQIYATAGGVTSSVFQQPQYQNSQGSTSPPLDFFETCPIQTIDLEVAHVGSGQTTFVTGKGASGETVYATLTDIMGNTTLPNTNGGVILSRVPLTWSASNPGAVGPSSACVETCALSTPVPGSGTVTASCSPPTCNAGFPLIPQSLSTPAAIDSCTQFFEAQAPAHFSCQLLIPSPVYASTAISGVVTGSTTSASVLASSTGCSTQAPSTCSSSIYSLSTAKAVAGPENPLPVAPNSMLYDLAGDKVYMGSEFGAQLINPANFGGSNNPYTALGNVTGTALAVSYNGTVGAFSDTIHSPNQVYIVNSSNVNSLSAVALNITDGVAASFSPDGLKVFLFGNGGSSLYVYSPQQAFYGPVALTGPANAHTVAFAPNAAFAFVATAAANGNPASLSAFNTCNNQLAAPPVPLPANPLFLKVMPAVHIDGTDSSGNLIPDGVHVFVLDSTGFDVITSTITPPPAGTLCPQTLTFSPAQRVNLNQGTIQPVNFFASADGSQIYIGSASNSSILVFDFGTGGVTGIELLNNATPVSMDMSVDAGTIVIAGSDGLLHEVSTALGGNDTVQLSFPALPNYLNPFCTYNPPQSPCALNIALVKP